MASPAPTEWDAPAAALWTQGRHADAVARAATAAHEAQWLRPGLALQCAYYLFQLKDHATALSVLSEQHARTPGNVQVQENLAVLHARLAQWAPAVEMANRVLSLDAANFNACDTLARALHALGREAEAAQAGTRSLHLKDTRVTLQADPRWRLPGGTPAEFTAGKRDVIAFSLWGGEPRYLRGALRNLLLAPDLYPGWEVHLHMDRSVPRRFIAQARELGAKVYMHRDAPLRERLAWRFLVANVPGVGRFLVRDADAVIGVREAVAVQAWVASGRWFHVMRDWWTHTDVMLAGMWGGVAGVLPDLRALQAGYQPPSVETANIDQWFLRDRVWPFVRQSCLVHDRCFGAPGSERFPGPVPPGDAHVGQCEYSVRAQEQARLLGPWLARLEGEAGRRVAAVYQSLQARKLGEMPAGDDAGMPPAPRAP